MINDNEALLVCFITQSFLNERLPQAEMLLKTKESLKRKSKRPFVSNDNAPVAAVLLKWKYFTLASMLEKKI